MPEFSGKSWKELNDIWPTDIRINSEVWKIMAVAPAAWIATKPFMITLLGETIDTQSFQTLCWVLRCQEAKDDIATEAWAPMKGLGISGNIWYNRKAKLTRLGLIENAPIGRFRMYRVTGKGKMIVRYYVDQLEQAHKNLRYWLTLQPEKYAIQVTKYLNKYWPGWNEIENL